MVESNSGKVMWSIKKEDFLRGKFDDATLELGKFVWSLTSNNKNPIRGDTLSLSLSFEPFKEASKCNLISCFQASVIIYLEGLDGRYNLMKAWKWLDVQFKVDNSLLSFDEKYLFFDGTYRIGINVRQDISIVDFTSPDHALILGPSDAGCLLIEKKRIYVSKAYFSAQSPYFKALFFGDFKEKSQEVIMLNDVKFDIFKAFLGHLYADFHVYFRKKDNRTSIPEVLALSDMFLCNTVTRSCETNLLEKDALTVADLGLADKYRLYYLRINAIAQLPIDDLKKYLAHIVDSPEAMHTRHLILDRIEDQGSW